MLTPFDVQPPKDYAERHYNGLARQSRPSTPQRIVAALRNGEPVPTAAAVGFVLSSLFLIAVVI